MGANEQRVQSVKSKVASYQDNRLGLFVSTDATINFMTALMQSVLSDQCTWVTFTNEYSAYGNSIVERTFKFGTDETDIVALPVDRSITGLFVI